MHVTVLGRARPMRLRRARPRCRSPSPQAMISLQGSHPGSPPPPRSAPGSRRCPRAHVRRARPPRDGGCRSDGRALQPPPRPRRLPARPWRQRKRRATWSGWWTPLLGSCGDPPGPSPSWSSWSRSAKVSGLPSALLQGDAGPPEPPRSGLFPLSVRDAHALGVSPHRGPLACRPRRWRSV